MTGRHAAARPRPLDVLRSAPARWLAAAGKRAAWTALAVLVPFVPALLDGTADPLIVAGTAGGAALVALLTAVVSLPEGVGARVSPWLALAARVARQAAQTALAAVGTEVVVLQVVDWPAVGRLVAAAALTTAVRGLAVLLWPGAALPESKPTTTHPEPTEGASP